MAREPGVTWTLISRRRKTDDEVVHDTYDSFQTAKEFANELVTYHKHYEARVNNSKGVEVYNTRKAGVTPRPRKKGA